MDYLISSSHNLNKQILLLHEFYRTGKTGFIGFNNLSNVMILVSSGTGKLNLNPIFNLHDKTVKHENNVIESVLVRLTFKKTGGRQEQHRAMLGYWVIQV